MSRVSKWLGKAIKVLEWMVLLLGLSQIAAFINTHFPTLFNAAIWFKEDIPMIIADTSPFLTLGFAIVTTLLGLLLVTRNWWSPRLERMTLRWSRRDRLEWRDYEQEFKGLYQALLDVQFTHQSYIQDECRGPMGPVNPPISLEAHRLQESLRILGIRYPTTLIHFMSYTHYLAMLARGGRLKEAQALYQKWYG